MCCIVGIDFDNTIVSYDAIMHKIALQWELIDRDIKKDKKEIRDKIRQLPNGETAWQRLQAFVYGKVMDEAVLSEGVKEFFYACKNAGIPASIVSHKTEFARIDEDRVNLRERALMWMQKNGFFNKEGLGLSQECIYFESTRQAKIERIKRLRCTHFIDDLEETFEEESFPVDVEKILFAPGKETFRSQGIKVLKGWHEINEYFFAARKR